MKKAFRAGLLKVRNTGKSPCGSMSLVSIDPGTRGRRHVPEVSIQCRHLPVQCACRNAAPRSGRLIRWSGVPNSIPISLRCMPFVSEVCQTASYDNDTLRYRPDANRRSICCRLAGCFCVEARRQTAVFNMSDNVSPPLPRCKRAIATEARNLITLHAMASREKSAPK